MSFDTLQTIIGKKTRCTKVVSAKCIDLDKDYIII